jgi:hypothetical protein
MQKGLLLLIVAYNTSHHQQIKHGVVIWGSTKWTQFGYSHNKNLQFHMKDKWEDEKFIDSDPRNNMVEPKLVIDEYKKLDKNKPVACATE